MNRKTFFKVIGLVLFFSILFISVAYPIISAAQSQGNTWAKSYQDLSSGASRSEPPNLYDKGRFIVKVKDGNYLILGDQSYGSSFCLIKINVNGQIIWSKKYHSTVNVHGANSLASTKDGGCIVSYANSYLTKIDESGRIIWKKKYSIYRRGYQGRFKSFIIRFVQELSDSSLIICGGADYSKVGLFAVVSKLNEAGDIIWAKEYNGSPGGSHFLKIMPLKSGGFILGGDKIFKLDLDGNPKWAKIYLNDNWKQHTSTSQVGILKCFCLTKNDEIIICQPRYDRCFATTVSKLNKNGDWVWSTWICSPRGPCSSVNLGIAGTLEDGNIILAGTTSEFTKYHHTASRIVNLKMDQNGSIQWINVIGPDFANNDTINDSVVEAENGVFVCVGSSGTFSFVNHSVAIFVVKSGLNGEVDIIEDFLTEVDINDKKIVRITHPKVIVKDIKPETYNVEWKIDEAELIILGDSGNFAEKTN